MVFLVQMIGFIAWVLLTVSYWQKRKINLVFFQIIAYILYAIHFAFLDGFTGALCNIVGIIFLILILIKEKFNKRFYWAFFLIILLYFCVGISCYDGFYTILPVVACVIPLISNWQKNTIVIKVGGIIGSLCWIVYGLNVASYSTLITEIIFIISTTIALFSDDK